MFLLGILGAVSCIAYCVSHLTTTAPEDSSVNVHRMIVVGPGGPHGGEKAASGSPAQAQAPHNASFSQRCWELLQLVSPLSYASIELGFSTLMGLFLVAYQVPLANEFMFPELRYAHNEPKVLWIILVWMPYFCCATLYPHFILRSCVEGSADATYWQRVSLVESLFFIVLAFVLNIVSFLMTGENWLAGGIINIILFIIHIPLTFTFIGRALNRSMLRCWFAFSLEWLNLILVYYLPEYRKSSAFQWSAPFLLCLTSIFSKHTLKNADWISPEVTPRLQVTSLVGSGLFTRLSQSFVLDNYRLTVGLEVYYALLSLFFQVTLYQRIEWKNRIISRLVENGITKILCWEISAPGSTIRAVCACLVNGDGLRIYM